VGLPSRMDEEALEQMQNQIAFLERAVSDVVFRQQKEIQAAEAKLKAVSDRLDSVRSDEALRPLEQERPPHY
jgi:uncharacterized coiled-coil protein SlyX